jgi:MerR family mercuric resistance operon transcriptional regulator
MTEKNPAPTLSVGELAQRCGVSADTLRYYERKGVIARPARGVNGYRRYPEETLARVQLVRRALTVGFTLDELARLLRMRDAGKVPCLEVRKLAGSKLEEIERRLQELVAVRDDLRTTLRTWDTQLAGTPSGKPARLLESLAPSSASVPKGAAPFSTNHKRKKNGR